MADAWIKKVALEIGLREGGLYSALAYAGTQDWLADNQKEGWTSLTVPVKLGLHRSQPPKPNCVDDADRQKTV
jgi:hypothetical protein